MKLVLQNSDEMNARIYHFPTSAIKLNGQKINYYHFLMNAEFEECNQAIKRIVPRINISKINDFIYTIPYLTDLQRKFYSSYITARYEKIMKPAYENVLSLDLLQEEQCSQSECTGLKM